MNVPRTESDIKYVKLKIFAFPRQRCHKVATDIKRDDRRVRQCSRFDGGISTRVTAVLRFRWSRDLAFLAGSRVGTWDTRNEIRNERRHRRRRRYRLPRVSSLRQPLPRVMSTSCSGAPTIYEAWDRGVESDGMHVRIDDMQRSLNRSSSPACADAKLKDTWSFDI